MLDEDPYTLRPEAVLQRRFYEKAFWEYAANLQKNTYLQETFLKEHLARAASVRSKEAIHICSTDDPFGKTL